MVASGHLALDHVEKYWVVNEVVLLAIDRQSPSHGTELGDARRHQKTAFLQHAKRLAERLQTVFPIAQMVHGPISSTTSALSSGRLTCKALPVSAMN